MIDLLAGLSDQRVYPDSFANQCGIVFGEQFITACRSSRRPSPLLNRARRVRR